MNSNLLAIIRRIVAEQGEGILGEPARLKGFVSDYAKNEPKEDRVAFGRAVEQGFYLELKRAAPQDRWRVKAELVSRLGALTGFDSARCAAAVDLLEAAMPSIAAAPGAQSAYRGGASGGTPAPVSGGASAAPAMPRITKRTAIFGAAAGAGALVGELMSELSSVHQDGNFTFFQYVLRVGIWAAFVGLGISIALTVAQTLHLKKQLDAASIIKSALMGIAVGVAGGAAAQIIYGLTANISTSVEIVSRIICWGILGWGLGLGASFYVPNYPKNRAMLAGLTGGVVGGAIFRALIEVLPVFYARIFGITILGIAIGLAISWVEEALREAWLTVIWGPKETVTISLGAKPVVFGSSREADVYLPSRRGDVPVPPVRAVVSVENGQVVLDDKQAGRRSVLQNGGEFTLDRLRVAVHTKQ